MIKIEELKVIFGSKKVLDNVNIEFKKGKFTAIVGPNGCGKSTLVKVIANLIKPESGKVIISGKDRREYNKKYLAQKLAFLMQFKESNNNFKVKEIVAYGRQPYIKAFRSFKKEDYEIIDWVLIQTNIYHLKERLINTLSGGEKQRVYLALALAQEPEVLILDEPTNHLDLKYQYDILNLVRELNLQKKMTIICVLHDLNHAMRFADEVVMIKDGNVFKKGNINECIDEETIYSVYDIKCNLHKNSKYRYLEVV